MLKPLIATAIFTLSATPLVFSQTSYKSQARNTASKNNTWTGERDYSKFSVDNIIYSGNLGFNFYSNIFSIGGGPIIGYKFNDYISSGIRLGYNYSRQKNYNYSVDDMGNIKWEHLHNHYMQGGLWTRISPIQSVYAHVEYEHHRLIQKYYPDQKYKFNINSLMVGLGFKQPITDRLSYCYTILYDVLQNTEKNSYIDPFTGIKTSLSPYANTVDIRVGIYYNF